MITFHCYSNVIGTCKRKTNPLSKHDSMSFSHINTPGVWKWVIIKRQKKKKLLQCFCCEIFIFKMFVILECYLYVVVFCVTKIFHVYLSYLSLVLGNRL